MHFACYDPSPKKWGRASACSRGQRVPAARCRLLFSLITCNDKEQAKSRRAKKRTKQTSTHRQRLTRKACFYQCLRLLSYCCRQYAYMHGAKQISNRFGKLIEYSAAMQRDPCSHGPDSPDRLPARPGIPQLRQSIRTITKTDGR